MSQGKQPQGANAVIGGMEASKLREMLTKCDDNSLALFLKSYALGFSADQFTAAMELPNERAMFLVALSHRYPNDWKEALAILAAGK